MRAFVLFGHIWFIFLLLWVTGRQERATEREYDIWLLSAYVVAGSILVWFGYMWGAEVLRNTFITNLIVGSLFLAILGPKLCPGYLKARF